MQTTPNVKLTINVPADLHLMIKTHAVLTGSTMRDYILNLVTNSMKQNKAKLPNKETMKALKAAKSGKTNLYKNVNELFNKLDKMKK